MGRLESAERNTEQSWCLLAYSHCCNVPFKSASVFSSHILESQPLTLVFVSENYYGNYFELLPELHYLLAITT
jgi:hypothetical protein